MPEIQRPRKRLLALLLGLTTILAGQGQAGSESIRLPAMGDPADQTLSPSQEKSLGEAFMRQVRAQVEIIDDPEIEEYLRALGNRLTEKQTLTGPEYTFFIVQDPEINAFAAPGGYIGVNSGLVLAAKTEAQLAAVIAHEAAHVSQRHLARAYAAAQKSTLPAAAAILAAIVLGGVSSEASQAALYTGVAASSQMQINFTRANEYEADRIGIGILANAGFDPDAMGDFFWILQKNTGRASDQVPEFLRTHPVSDARVAEARNRAAQYKTDKQIKDSKEFRQAQMQILVRTSADVGRLQQRLEKSIPDDVSDRSEILEYGLALSLHRQEKFEQAQQLIDSLLEKAPRDGNYLRLAGANAFALGKQVRGREIFEGLLDIYPLHYPTLIQYADSLEGVGENEAATKLLRKFVRNSEREKPHAYAALARNAEKAGHQLESLEALAENYYLTGRPKLAVSQLKRASELVQPGSTHELRIKDKLIKMRAEAAEALRENP